MRLLPLLVLLPACSVPTYEASRTVDFTVPAAGIAALSCTSHNGAIVVVGENGRQEFAVRVEITARGNTQAEADDNLAQLDVDRATSDGVLRLVGKVPEELPGSCSPVFAFTVTVPRDCGLELETHNGSIEVKDTKGRVSLQTHNGKVVADVTSTDLDVVTHNGSISLTANGDAPINGRVESHNGSVNVKLPPGNGTKVSARSGNGSVNVKGAARVDGKGENSAEVSYGEGNGKLSVSTHNGAVWVR
ncbi:MAG: DUF4097 family beta strand repeat protein [Planctomycetes bacterium]|nr:DUF4097 family beta strand repeat protein [Planctomycetota bacterium]MCB9884482.1 DUF4097 family beta strand repeat protein [Planctomycetota bacterium]